MKDNVGQRAPAHRSPRQDPCFDPLIRSPVSRDSRAAASGSFLDWKGLRWVLDDVIAGPAVEPNVHPTIGAGVRIGRRFGVLAEVDRARAFTLSRGGLFVGW